MDKSRIAFARAAMAGTVARLAGKDASGRVVPVSLAAKTLIDQATSPQRLSRMYEGWMAWL